MKKILVIDDSPDVCEIVAAILADAGFEALTAGDGRTGIALAKQHLPDLVLCDVRMPGTDGYGVLNELRQHAPTATTPFIFLTGLGDATEMRRGMNEGADDYLSKPFRFEDLLAAVRSRLDKQAKVADAADTKFKALRESISLSLPHELLTPLNGILGLSSMLVDDVARLTAEEIKDYARTIHTSAERLNRLVGNFVLLSKLELQQRGGEPQPFPTGRTAGAAEVIHRAIQSARRRHPRAGEVLPLVEDAALPLDPDHLAKVVEELLDNAMKFAPENSPVRLVARRTPAQYQIEIVDRGPGMTPEAVAKAGPQFQHGRHEREQQGAGLGLAIAMRLVALNRGELKIDSAPQKGTTARVLLPLEA